MLIIAILLVSSHQRSIPVYDGQPTSASVHFRYPISLSIATTLVLCKYVHGFRSGSKIDVPNSANRSEVATIRTRTRHRWVSCRIQWCWIRSWWRSWTSTRWTTSLKQLVSRSCTEIVASGNDPGVLTKLRPRTELERTFRCLPFGQRWPQHTTQASCSAI